MRELSIFIDESGDFGPFDPNVPYYIVAMVFHEQSNDIRPYMRHLDGDLVDKNIRSESIHTRPLLRHEPPYESFTLQQQRYLLNRLYLFAKKCDLRYKLFVFDRRECRTPEDLEKRLARDIAAFVAEEHDWLAGYTRVIMYYDDGQKRLSHILSESVEDMLPNLERRHLEAVDYRQYRLAQVADLACCLELSQRRYAMGRETRSERIVFGSRRDFYKGFYKGFKKKQM